MKTDLCDRLLLAQIAVLDMIATAGRRIRRVAGRPFRDQRGQTPTEYLMIVGLMAVVIVTVFVFYYWSNVQKSAQTWVSNVKDAVTGKDIKK
jgi:Flp pilus assembly pilin Flp